MWTKGGINAKALGAVFAQGKITAGSAVVGDAVTGVTISHGLAATPDFVFGFWHGTVTPNSDRVIAATTSSTEVRFHWLDTDAATTGSLSYIVGILG